MSWLQRMANAVRAVVAPVPAVASELWLQAIAGYPFLQSLPLQEQAKLRALSALFLQHKQFHGAHGLKVSDAMAVTIAAQACLPLLHWGEARSALRNYDDFVGIVVHPATMVATRDTLDENGIVHRHRQLLDGEAMERGPVTLSWQAIADSGAHAERGSNVVIHEFMHKIDMRNGHADGYPPLPAGFMGTASAAQARQRWLGTWQPAFARFREAVAKAQRFGEPAPWLDAYGATAPGEFFAVACEAYFVNRPHFQAEWPELDRMLQAYFQPLNTPSTAT